MYTPGFEQVTFRYVMKLYTTTWTYRFNVSRMSHVKFVDLYQYQEFADLYQKHADLFILHIKICFLNRPDPGSTNELMDCHTVMCRYKTTVMTLHGRWLVWVLTVVVISFD